MNVYEVFVNECRIPCTVIAASYEEAEQLYQDWRVARGLGVPCKWKQVARHDDSWLADHPELEDLARQGTAGIAYWVSHRDGWAVASPEDEPIGGPLPRDPIAKCFWIEADDGPSVMISASGPEHAMTMFLAWNEIARGGCPRRFTIQERSRWRLTGNMYTLREQMDAEMMGIAAYSKEDGWNIFPPDDERVIP